MPGWALVVCVIVGAFMAWRERYLSSRKPPVVPSYLAGIAGGLGATYFERLTFQDPGGLGGEIFLVLLFSIGGGGLAVALVDLATQHEDNPPRKSAPP